MKIAIQGHPTRGKEVIQILESLGGKNREELTGRRISQYYFINCNGVIDLNLKSNLFNRKFYTLEEFETQFPFKIGDKVTFKDGDYPSYTIKSFSIWSDGDIVCEFKENGLHYSINKLKSYKEMKEERNITLTLDKAKEWYNKGGELKEIALQAFSENELNPLPKSWEEFCEKYPVKNGECWVGTQDVIYSATMTQDRKYKNWNTSRRSAKAHLAMIQLEQLRNCWWGDWKPTWGISQKWCIRLFNGVPSVGITTNISKFLTFPTKEMAEEFLECFRDLIELAGDLI